MKNGTKLSASLLASMLAITTSCVVDGDYDRLTLDDIDTEMTFMGEGVGIPLGSTNQAKLKNLLGGIKELEGLLTADENGDYSFHYSGDYSLDETIAELDLASIRSFDGMKFSEENKTRLSDISTDDLTFESETVEHNLTLGEVDLSSIVMPDIDVQSEPAKAGFTGYGLGSADMGENFTSLNHTNELFSPAKEVTYGMFGTTTIAGAASALAQYTNAGENGILDIQAIFDANQLSNIEFEQYEEDITANVSLGSNSANIASVSNLTLGGGAALKVDMEVENPIISEGTLTPNVNLDMSSVLKFKDGSMISLSSLVMNKANGWKASKNFPITSLAAGQPSLSEGMIKILGKLKAEGSINLTGAKTTLATINAMGGKPMNIKLAISVVDLTIAGMDVTLADNITVGQIAPMEVELSTEAELPETVKSVGKILMDPAKPLKLDISAKNLSAVKASNGQNGLSVIPTVVLTFPEGVELASPDEGTTNRMTFTGNLADGNITRDIVIKSITPTVSGGKVGFTGKVVANASAKVAGTFNVCNLPSKPEDDVQVSCSVKGTLDVADFSVELDPAKIEEHLALDEHRDFDYSLEGMDDFGTFLIGLEGTPTASFEIALPQMNGIKVLAEDITIHIPEMMTITPGEVPGYSASDHSIHISGEFPDKVLIPIHGMKVTPVKDAEGKLHISDDFTIKGKAKLSSYSMHKSDMEAISGATCSVKAVIPQLKAKTITLEGNYNKQLEYSIADIELVSEDMVKELPEQLKSIETIEFENLKLCFGITPANVPDFGTDLRFTDISITLPEYFRLEGGSNVLQIPSQVIRNGREITAEVALTGVSGETVNLLEGVKGDLKFQGRLVAEHPSVDLTALNKDITLSMRASVGNGNLTSAGKILVSKIVAKVDYPVEAQTKVDFSDLPEMLRGDNLVLDVDPVISLNIASNLGLPIGGSLELIPYRNGAAVSEEAIVLDNVNLPCSPSAGQTLTTRLLLGSNVKPQNGVDARRVDLRGLLMHIPDALELKVNAGVDPEKNSVVEPAAKYSCKVDYSLDVPLQFGKEFKFIMDDMTVDISETVGSIIAITPVTLKGTVLSTLPLGVNLELALLDENGTILPMAEEAAVRIEPCSNGKEAQTSLSLTLALDESCTEIPAQIVIRANVDAAENGQCVNENDYIQICDMDLFLPNGFTYDPLKH